MGARDGKTPATPRWGLVRTYTAQALGSGGLESARHLLSLSRIVFRNLYQIAHSERLWKSGITSPSGNYWPYNRSNSGSLAMLAAMRRALAAMRRALAAFRMQALRRILLC